MNEKRFTGKLLTNSNGEEFGFTIYDEDKRMSIDEVIGVLNEQQATIQSLEEEIKLLKPTNIEQYEQIQKLRKELNDCEKFRYTVFKRMGDVLDE